ncbi:MAG: hypothetical protein AMS17_06450 [Spirochaetes bacterium DG_61]|jgi:hypothetical protein|nr:MAG: hypothetical protein AMS17_06450 [Spirochaetes bacterium DG_61]
MIDRKPFVFFNAVMLAVNESAYTLRYLKKYPRKAWEKAQVKVWGQKWLGIGESVSNMIEQYFKQVRISMSYRSLYECVTKSLKDRYKHLKKRP